MYRRICGAALIWGSLLSLLVLSFGCGTDDSGTRWDLDGDAEADGSQDVGSMTDTTDTADTTTDTTHGGDADAPPTCEDGQPGRITRHINDGGADYQLAVGEDFHDFKDVEIDGSDTTSLDAVTTFRSSDLNIAAAISSTDLNDDSDPRLVLAAAESVMGSFGNLVARDLSPEMRPRADVRNISGEFLLDLQSPLTSEQVRHQILAALGPAGAGELDGVRTSEGSESQSFRIMATAQVREARRQVLLLLAVTPAANYFSREDVYFSMSDVTSVNGLASTNATIQRHCDAFSSAPMPKIDYYWVIDPRIATPAAGDHLIARAKQFYEALDSAHLDFRIGVASMNPSKDGTLDGTNGWHTTREDFLASIRQILADADPDAPSDGLEAARRGISKMKGLDLEDEEPRDAIRPDAVLSTIFVSPGPFDAPSTGDSSDFTTDEYVAFYKLHTIANGLFGDGGSCGEVIASPYQTVIDQTGGAHASLCDTTSGIMYLLTRDVFATDPPVLSAPAIPASLSVSINGRRLSRSLENGFDYLSTYNLISYYGQARDLAHDDSDTAILYEFLAEP